MLQWNGTNSTLAFSKRGESVQSYISDLKNKASTCEFGDLKDEMIKDRLVCGIENDKLKRRRQINFTESD